jgi:hypothetical protein
MDEGMKGSHLRPTPISGFGVHAKSLVVRTQIRQVGGVFKRVVRQYDTATLNDASDVFTLRGIQIPVMNLYAPIIAPLPVLFHIRVGVYRQKWLLISVIVACVFAHSNDLSAVRLGGDKPQNIPLSEFLNDRFYAPIMTTLHSPEWESAAPEVLAVVYSNDPVCACWDIGCHDSCIGGVLFQVLIKLSPR